MEHSNIYDDTVENRNIIFGMAYGGQVKYITVEEIEALLSGKIVMFSVMVGEYVLGLRLGSADEKYDESKAFMDFI